jgi:hypothetical protein
MLWSDQASHHQAPRVKPKIVTTKILFHQEQTKSNTLDNLNAFAQIACAAQTWETNLSVSLQKSSCFPFVSPLCAAVTFLHSSEVELFERSNVLNRLGVDVKCAQEAAQRLGSKCVKVAMEDELRWRQHSILREIQGSIRNIIPTPLGHMILEFVGEDVKFYTNNFEPPEVTLPRKVAFTLPRNVASTNESVGSTSESVASTSDGLVTICGPKQVWPTQSSMQKVFSPETKIVHRRKRRAYSPEENELLLRLEKETKSWSTRLQFWNHAAKENEKLAAATGVPRVIWPRQQGGLQQQLTKLRQGISHVPKRKKTDTITPFHYNIDKKQKIASLSGIYPAAQCCIY